MRVPGVRQQVRVARALRDNHYQHYERMSRVTVGLARLRTWLRVLTIGQHLKPLTDSGDRRLHMSEKLSSGT